MTFRRALIAIGWFLVVLLFSPHGLPAAETPDAARRQEIETVIREYLRVHPEVVMEALQEMERRQQEAQKRQRAEAVRTYLTELTQDPGSPVGGNPQGQVTIVEFFDYQCGYCKRVTVEIKKLLQTDSDVRLVYRALPILGPVSVFSARAALAAHRQGKYEPLHAALMETNERLTEQKVLQLAAQVGLDVAQLEKAMADPTVAAALDRNFDLQRKLNIQGTPALVVGMEFIPGAADVATLKKLVEQARRK
jgi:protein-disulfide isomerase